MSVVQNGTDLGLTGFTPELKNPTAATATTEAVDNSKVSELVAKNKEQAANASQQAKEVKQEPLTPAQLEKVAQQLQDFVGEMNRGLQFTVDKDSGRDVIKVIDKSSGDLVKQYPSEEVLTLVAKLSDMVGGFVNAKV